MFDRCRDLITSKSEDYNEPRSMSEDDHRDMLLRRGGIGVQCNDIYPSEALAHFFSSACLGNSTLLNPAVTPPTYRIAEPTIEATVSVLNQLPQVLLRS